MRLGELISEYRKKHNMSMEDFHRVSGISKSYIGFLEKGAHPQTGKPITPSYNSVMKAAKAFGIHVDTLMHMINEDICIEDDDIILMTNYQNSISIPVMGRVAAGSPIDAIEDVIDYVVIPEDMAAQDEYFGLKIKGRSMEPQIFDGDIVIVRKSAVAETGDIVIATVHSDDAVCKKLKTNKSKTILRSLNHDFEDIDVTGDTSFRILGVVVELRRKL